MKRFQINIKCPNGYKMNRPTVPRFHGMYSYAMSTQDSESSFVDTQIKKGTNKQGIDEVRYDYLLKHTREPEILRQLREDTAENFPQAAHMAVSPEQGAFLAWLVSTLGCTRVIEVGVFTGYSSIAMALELPNDGKLYACDRDPRALEMAEKYWESAGISSKITKLLGPAEDSLHTLLEDGQANSFDFAFVDADKRGYKKYFELLLKLIRPGGVIVFDNVLWYGKVADQSIQDKTTVALRELNESLLQDDRVAVSLIPVGDGLFLCRKKDSS